MSVTEPTEVWVTLGERRMRLVLPGEWTLDEAKLAKEASGGLSLAAIELGLFIADPHAWHALLQVMLRREGLPPDELDDVELVTMIDALAEAARAKLQPAMTVPRSRLRRGKRRGR